MGARMHRSTFVVVAADRLCLLVCVCLCVVVYYTSAVPALVFVCIFTHTHAYKPP